MSSPATARFAFQLLGPFTFTRDGVGPGRVWPKARTLLALLLVAEGPVSLHRIEDELWPRGGPESAISNIRNYVLTLRRELRTDAVRTLPSAYQLCLPERRLDSRAFLALLDRAECEGDPAQRADTLRGALNLWNGPALSGIPLGPVLRGWVDRMNGHRRQAVIDLAGLLLRAGRYGGAQDLLRQHLMDHPADETAHLLLMHTLYLAGDSRAALAAYEEADRSLTASGMLPGPRLRGAQEAILSHRPLPDAPQAALSPGGGLR